MKEFGLGLYFVSLFAYIVLFGPYLVSSKNTAGVILGMLLFLAFIISGYKIYINIIKNRGKK